MQEPVKKYLGPPPNPGWLERMREDVLEPELQIIDAHHHLWDHPGDRYLLDEMLADIALGHRVVGTVYVQGFAGYRPDGPEAMRPVGETEYVTAIAEECLRREPDTHISAAIVGYAELLLGDAVTPILEAHCEAAKGRFRGVRRIAARDAHVISAMYQQPMAGMLADYRFREGVAALGRLGLSYDAYIFHHQLDELADLADGFPNISFILNHAGAPIGIGPYAEQRAEVFDIWRCGMKRLGERPNVFLKLGGMAIQLFGFAFNEQPLPPSSGELTTAWRPYVEEGIAAFGPARVMFESNFPADKGGASYVAIWNAFKRMTVAMPTGERADMFHGTAARVYRI